MSDNASPLEPQSGKPASGASGTEADAPSSPATAEAPSSHPTAAFGSRTTPTGPSSQPPYGSPGSLPPAGAGPAYGYPPPPSAGYSQSPAWPGPGPRPAGFGAAYPGGAYPPQNGAPHQSWQGQGYVPAYGPGAIPTRPTWGPPPAYASWNALSIAGFVLSFLIAPVGLVLSIIALVQIHRSREKSRGMAIAGIVISVVNMVLAVLLILGLVWALGQYSSGDSYSCAGSDCTPSWLDTDYGQTDEYAVLRQSAGASSDKEFVAATKARTTHGHAGVCTAPTFG